MNNVQTIFKSWNYSEENSMNIEFENVQRFLREQ